MRGVILSALLASAAGSAVELTTDNWEAEIGTKAAFVKFLAPWWGHCKKMKPDWDSLAADFKDSTTVVIADVDCTTTGKSLCEKKGIKGYPTIKFYNPPDEDGEDYKGGRDLEALKKFASTELGPGCSVDQIDNCSDEQKTELKTYIDMDPAERAAKLEALKTELATTEEVHNELLKSLQAQYKESQDGLEKLKEASAPQIKLLKSATPAVKAEGKDEM